jgi:hypothetical protein
VTIVTNRAVIATLDRCHHADDGMALIEKLPDVEGVIVTSGINAGVERIEGSHRVETTNDAHKNPRRWDAYYTLRKMWFLFQAVSAAGRNFSYRRRRRR